ncbi:MAG TPA: hypothetical protein PLD57_01650 [Aggregatilineales bacterium]|nr:hypothetical protein [Aggregatilineales bacterium]
MEKLRAYFKSFWRFAPRVVRYWWAVLLVLALDLVDLFARLAELFPFLRAYRIEPSPTYWAAILVITLFFAASLTYHEDRAREPALSIVFESERPFVHKYSLSRQTQIVHREYGKDVTISSAYEHSSTYGQNLGHQQVSGVLYRIAVKNTGDGTVERVSVKAEKTQPDMEELPQLPATLRFMNDNIALFPEEKVLKQGEQLFIDVIEQQYFLETDTYTTFLHDTVAGKRRIIPPKDFTLTLAAYGKDVPPCRRDFAVSFEDNLLKFSPIDQ